MISLKNEKNNVIQIGEGFSLVFLVFGPFAWIFKGIPSKFVFSFIKCCLFIPYIMGFMGGFNKELLQYYINKGYSRI